MRLSNTLFTLLTVIWVVGAAVSCSEQNKQDARQDVEEKRSVEPVNTYMAGHFDQVTNAQGALIRGDLDETHAISRRLAQQPAVEQLPEGWEPFVEEIKTAARLTSEAKTYKAAAAATSAMVKTCGECHRAAGVKPGIPEIGMKGLPPADQIETVPQMLRHRWAVERMWVGLINPSEAAWNEGVDILANVPLKPQNMTDNAELKEDVVDLARPAHDVGEKATRVDDWDERALLYGQLLATCAECHRKLGLSIERE